MAKTPDRLELSTEVAETIVTSLMWLSAALLLPNRTCKSLFAHAKVQRG
jgi:hypothetical protein